MPAAGNFVAFSQFLAAFCTLDFTRSPLEAEGDLVFAALTTPSMMPTATKHFDRAASWSLYPLPWNYLKDICTEALFRLRPRSNAVLHMSRTQLIEFGSCEVRR